MLAEFATEKKHALRSDPLWDIVELDGKQENLNFFHGLVRFRGIFAADLT